MLRQSALHRQRVGPVQVVEVSHQVPPPQVDGDGLQADSRFMRALESAAAGMTSLDRLRSVMEELDAEKADSGGELPAAVGDALASGDAAALLREWDSLESAATASVLRALALRVDVVDASIEVSQVTAADG